MKSQDSRTAIQKRLASLKTKLFSLADNPVARYRNATHHGIRAQRRKLSRPSTYWNGKSWAKMGGTARYVGFNPGRSRHRAYAEKVSKGELERREANWRKSKVGRAFLRRRREGRYPTVQSAEAIQEGVERKRELCRLRREYLSWGEYQGGDFCPVHEAELPESQGFACNCPAF